MRSMSATEMVTSPTTTAPLLSTRSRVSHSETRSLSRIEMRSSAEPFASGFVIGVQPGFAASVQLLQAIENFTFASVKFLLAERSRFQAPMQLAELCREPLALLVHLLLRSLVDLAQDPEHELAWCKDKVVDQQHCRLNS